MSRGMPCSQEYQIYGIVLNLQSYQDLALRKNSSLAIHSYILTTKARTPQFEQNFQNDLQVVFVCAVGSGVIRLYY